ncbi:MAG: TIGR01212 family radical SAM protein [Acidobacteria bacterium]|nr:MAG: TIGR01212 family radical SAM protein [Acidobacteriota bacterium]
MLRNRYSSYGEWLKRRFGGPVYKVSVDGGFTCPNRDGTVARGGCTYCSNDSFRALGVGAGKPVRQQIEEGIRFLSSRFDPRMFIVYWQHYTNTHGELETLRSRFEESLGVDDRIVGIAIGTRADCVEQPKLEMIRELAREKFVCLEYGLESARDETLERINRGHDFARYVEAVERTHALDLPVCAHVILGFPWESLSQMLEGAATLNRLGIDFVKVHHLHVLGNTALGQEYLRRPFKTFSLEEWVALVCDFIELLAPAIVIQRLFGWAPEHDLLAPRWGVHKSVVLQHIKNELVRRDSWQGKELGAARPEE